MRFGQAVNTILASYGVRNIFGIPGVHTLELFRDIQSFGITPIIPRHEQGAGFMADGYARSSGAPGVCYFVTGPGVLNAMTAIAQAWHDSIPMLIVASTLPDPRAREKTGALHETPDIALTLAPYTRFSVNVSTIQEFAQAVHQAFHSWKNDAPRPVFIGIPFDILNHEVSAYEVSTELSALVRLSAPAPAPLEATIAELAASRRPALLIGGGAIRCPADVVALAERLNAPIVLTGNAKALLPDTHPLNLGTSLRSRASRQLLCDADLVILLGAQLSPIEYSLEPGERFEFARAISINLEPARLSVAPNVDLVPMDVGEFARAALAALNADAVPYRSQVSEITAARAAFDAARDEEPLAAWIAAIEASLPARVNIAVDSAQLAYQSHMYLRLNATQRWYAPYGLGSLGPALPLAIGAKIAEPAFAALAFAGDGGSLFTIPELATARDLGGQFTYVIWNNQGYREIRNSFERKGIAAVGVDVSAEDFSFIARGFGAQVHEVSTPAELGAALKTALRSPLLSVVIVAAE